MSEWRILQTPPARGAWNMGFDRWLMESVRQGGAPTLRLYEWSPPCLSLGRNQPARAAYDADALRRLGVDVVRRPTGGRAVLHDRELTYAAVLPARLLGGAKRAYWTINEVLLEAMRSLGTMPALAVDTARPAPIPSTVPCFAESLPGEVLLDGRKLIGSAQVHSEGVLLQHGSILIERSAFAEGVDAATGGGITDSAAFLRDALPTAPSVDQVRSAVAASWRERFGETCSAQPRPSEQASIADYAAQFERPDWTWRR